MQREQLVSLVIAAKAGDNEAMNALFGAFYNDVYYFALKTVKSEDLACDVTQETFVEIIRTLHKLQEPAAFVTWMKQITYHQCTRYFKKKKDVLVDEDETGATVFDTLTEEHTEFIPDEALDQDEFRKTILDILDELSEEQRAATMMFYFDELPIKQIAEIQGVSENTVKSRLNYARKSIKASVEEYENTYNVKLHAVPMVPLFGWLFKGSFEGGMSAASLTAVTEGIAAATGTTVSVAVVSATTASAVTSTVATTTAVGVGAKVAAIPIVTKIIVGVAATAIVVGGGTVAGIQLFQNADTRNHRSDEPTVEVQNTLPPTVNPSPTDELVLEGVLPEGCRYVLTDGTELTAGDAFPDTCTAGDQVWYGDYVYGYECIYTGNIEGGESQPWFMWEDVFDDGDSGLIAEDVFGAWSPRVVDMQQSTYGQIASRINGAPIRSLYGTFLRCVNLTEAPVIPSTVHSVSSTYEECTALQTAPVIPKNVQRLTRAFYGCTSLTGDVIIHATLDTSTFWYHCDVFSQTVNPINLVGDAPTEHLRMIALSSNNQRITVRGEMVFAIPDPEEPVMGYTVPPAAQYMCADGTVYEANAVVPIAVQVGDRLITTDYTYTYGENGWHVVVNEKTKSSYEALLGTINEAPLTDMNGTFDSCKQMVAAPKIPDGVRSLDRAFYYCIKLQEQPVIPDSVVTMNYTFGLCSKLQKAPVLPSGVRELSSTFLGCESLQTPPVLPDSVSKMDSLFWGCTALQTPPTIPAGVINLSGVFANCRSLRYAPTIPDGVKDIRWMFQNCTTLRRAPTIPQSVRCFTAAFQGCTVLTGEILIYADGISELDSVDCFKDTAQFITMVGTGTNDAVLAFLKTTANNGNVAHG